jgi:hypothetical protein
MPAKGDQESPSSLPPMPVARKQPPRGRVLGKSGTYTAPGAAQPNLVFVPSIYGNDYYGTVYYGGQWYVLLPPIAQPPAPPTPPATVPPFSGPFPPLPPPATSSTPGLLGTLVPSGYAIAPFIAEAVDYETLFISWTPPTGPFLDFRLVRNRYGFPADENDGTTLLDSGGSSYPGNNYFDSDVIPGAMHYYGIYILVQVGAAQVWYRAGLTAVLAVNNYDCSDIMLLDRIPEYYQIGDLSNPLELTTDALDNSYLVQFMQVFGWGLDYLKTQLALAENVNNASVIPVNWLVNLAGTVGFPYYPETDAATMRDAVANQAALVASRGTLSGIEDIVTQLTGWSTDIRPGINMMLEDDQAGFIDPNYPTWNPNVSYDAGEIVAWGPGGNPDYFFQSIASGNLSNTPPTNESSNSFWTNCYYSATAANIIVDGPVPQQIVLGASGVPALNTNTTGVYVQIAGTDGNTQIWVNSNLLPYQTGTAFVPAGGTITLTYGTAPTTFNTTFPTLLNSTTGWLNTWEPLIDNLPHYGFQTNAACLVERVGILTPPAVGIYTQNGLGITNNSGATANIELRSVSRSYADAMNNDQYPQRGHVIGDGIPVPFTLPRQTWYSWVEYFPGQVVSYEGMPYLALKASTGITPPTNGIPSNEWQPIGYDSRIALMLSGWTGQNLSLAEVGGYAVTPYVLWFDETGTFISSLYVGQNHTITSNQPQLIMFDSFAQPSNWGSAIGSPDIGNYFWSTQVSNFVNNAFQNGCCVPASTNTRTLEIINYGSANANVGVTLATLPNGGFYGGLVLRWASNTSYLRSDQYGIYEINGSSTTQLTAHSTPFLAGDRMVANCNGNVITVYRNNVAVSAVTTTFNNTQTQFGLVVDTATVLPNGTVQPNATRLQSRRTRSRVTFNGTRVATTNVARGAPVYPLAGPVRARIPARVITGREFDSASAIRYTTSPAPLVHHSQPVKARPASGRRGVTR